MVAPRRSIDKKVLKTGETGYVTATFNTRTFTGVHGATLTVEVRWKDGNNWRNGETQLRVDGNIRGDIVFQPGAVKFEDIDQGTTLGAKSRSHLRWPIGLESRSMFAARAMHSKSN